MNALARLLHSLPLLSDHRDWLDIIYDVSVILIGIAGACIAIKTLFAIKGQLTEIQKASKQTDEMIKQAEIQAESGRLAAQASADQARAIVDSERAWVMASMDWREGSSLRIAGGVSNGRDELSTYIDCNCQNEGKTIAWITEKWACMKLVDVPPPIPDYSDRDNVFQWEVQPLAAKQKDEGHEVYLTCPGTPDQRTSKTTLLYGYVKYRTIFGTEGETRFGYNIAHLESALERLPANFPEYNKNL